MRIHILLIMFLTVGCKPTMSDKIQGKWYSVEYGTIIFNGKLALMNDSIICYYTFKRNDSIIGFIDTKYYTSPDDFIINYHLLKLTNDSLVIKGILWSTETRIYTR